MMKQILSLNTLLLAGALTGYASYAEASMESNPEETSQEKSQQRWVWKALTRRT
jgi:hypothetical protein